MAGMTIKTTTPIDPNINVPAVLKVGRAFTDLTSQLNDIFPERRDLIEQIKYGLMTRENILGYGPTGTGKSDISATLFRAFRGADVFSKTLTKFMTESSIFGMADPKIMREEGRIVHRQEEGILGAHFAELDELFNANGPLLLSILDVLNERKYKRGRQVEPLKLHTALACTNGDPQEETKRDKSLIPHVDRFLFQCELRYLSERDNRIRMYTKFANGEIPSAELSYDELLEVSGIVVNYNQFTDPYYFEVHEDIISAIKPGLKRVISDRSTCKMLKVVEAEALLQGRYQVELDDFLALRYCLCIGDRKEEHELFMQTVEPILETAKEGQLQNADAPLIPEIGNLIAKMPVPLPDSSGADLVAMLRELRGTRKQMSIMRPQMATTREMVRKGLEQIDERIQAVNALIIGEEP